MREKRGGAGRPAIFGWYARHMIASYVLHTQMVMALLTAVALAVDVAPWISRVWAAAPGRGRSALEATLTFVFYRAVDNGVQVFPIACVLGVLWVEVIHARSGQRLMVLVTGRTSGRAMLPILTFALAVTALQFTFDNFVRPAAVMALIGEQLGSYRGYVHRPGGDQLTWLALPEGMLSAEMDPAAADTMRQVTYYRFVADDLRAILSASNAVPATLAPRPSGGFAWTLEDGAIWRFRPRRSADTAETPDPGSLGSSFSRQVVELAVDPEWLRYRGIAPQYLPLGALRHLASSQGIPIGETNYASWLWVRTAQAGTPALLAIFAAIVFRLLSGRRPLLLAIGPPLLVGYLGSFAMRMVAVLGAHSVLPPPVAALALPAGLALLSAAALRFHTRFDRAVPARARRGDAAAVGGGGVFEIGEDAAHVGRKGKGR